MKKTKPKPDIIYNELNESDSALDAFCMAHGTRITIIDEQIASLPDDNVNKAHLQQIRAGVERAHLARNGELLESRFETLTIGLKAAAHTIPLAVIGQKFNQGRKVNSGGPIRKSIARELNKNPALKNPELWAAVAAKPPKGWAAFDNRVGKYLEGPQNKNMNYERFCTVCGEERKKLNS